MIMKKEKVFLSGSFKTTEGEDFLKEIYNSLSKEYNVWWAPINVGRAYGTHDKKFRDRVVETEKRELRKSKVIVAVMKKATFGTWGEIIDGFGHKVPNVVLVQPENSGDYSEDFISAWFPYHVNYVVYNKDDLLQKVRELVKIKP